MVLQNPFQFNLVEIFKIHVFKTYLWSVYCVSRSKLDMRNRVLEKPRWSSHSNGEMDNRYNNYIIINVMME